MVEFKGLDVVVLEVEVSEDETEEYWTEERMAEAEPLPLPTLEGVSEEEFTRVMAEGDFVSEAPMGPDGDEEIEEAEEECCTCSEITNLSAWPYVTVGKLFMVFGGVNYVGSAWTIGESAVFTAGHCVYDHGGAGWASNLLFMPGYRDGAAKGKWYSGGICTLSAWANSGDYKADLGCFTTTKPIRPTTGRLGWWANTKASFGQPYDAVGYPADSPYNGERMWHCVGYQPSPWSMFSSDWNPLPMCNKMTPGCSGGPWIIQNGYAKGVNSHGYSTLPGIMFSPKFGTGFLNCVNWTDRKSVV